MTLFPSRSARISAISGRDKKHEMIFAGNVLRKRDDFFHAALRVRHETHHHSYLKLISR
jgi:hypothetical protein